MNQYEIPDLERWAEHIEELALNLGLSCYPQEFEISDQAQMLGYMAYSGLPSHYPHWSYGKAYERLKTMYDYGVTGLPYEMVINSNPCLAYLMRDNSLLMQVLTIAHVYGHNDFFKNNFTFRHTRAELAVDLFKVHANRIRRYIEDPSIGIDRVEGVLDSAHAISLQCRRNQSVVKPNSVQQEESQDPKNNPGGQPGEEDEDLLLFLRDNNSRLSEWERDLLTIVDEETRYFIPQMETKIMNEGWASYWHKQILDSLDLSPDQRMEFMVKHAQVLAPHPNRVNPYHLGFFVWNALRIWYDGCLDRELLRRDECAWFDKMQIDFEERDAVPPESGKKKGCEVLFQVRETDRDASFLRRFLTPAVMRELDLFQHESQKSANNGQVRVVTKTSSPEHWRDVKEILVRNVGVGSLPVIKVEDSRHGENSTLLLRHHHDGRDLELGSAEKTLAHVRRLWSNPVILKTQVEGNSIRLEA